MLRYRLPVFDYLSVRILASNLDSLFESVARALRLIASVDYERSHESRWRVGLDFVRHAIRYHDERG